MAYQRLMSSQLGAFLRNSAAIGSLVSAQALMVETLFQLQRQFLVSSCRGHVANAGTGPSQAEAINKIQKFAADNVSIRHKTDRDTKVIISERHPLSEISGLHSQHSHCSWMGCDKEESCRSKSSVLKCINDLHFNGCNFQFIDKKYQEGHHYVHDITRSNGDSFTKVTLFQPSVTKPWLLNF